MSEHIELSSIQSMAMTGLWLAPSLTTVSANDPGFLLRRRKANPDLRQSCAQEATRKNQAVGEEAIEPAKNIKKLNQGVCCQGTLLGIGDKHHALAPQLVQAFTQGKQTVNIHSKKWCEDHGTACSGGEIPDLRPRYHCSDICCKAELAFPTVSQDIQRQALGLVKNVCRSMKPQVQSDRKQLLPSAKHPILLAHCGDVVKAWLITQAVFKPLTFDGVRLDPPNMTLDDSPPHVFRLRTQAAGEKQILDFVSMRRVMAEIVSFAMEQPDTPVQYCLTRDYKSLVHTPLSNLHLNSPFAWVQLSSIVDESDDDDDDDAGGDDEGSRVEPDITELVSELLAYKAQEEPAAAAKSASKSSRSTFDLKRRLHFLCHFGIRSQELYDSMIYDI